MTETREAYKSISGMTRFDIFVRVATLIVVLLVGFLSLRVLYSTNAAASDAKRAADNIEDCTTPAGKCFQNGRAALANVVKQVEDNQAGLERSRTSQINELKANQAVIQDTLQLLCKQASITCADLPNPPQR